MATCLRPCCQQAASQAADKPSSTSPAQTIQQAPWSTQTISPDSIDPSIIQLKPTSPSSPSFSSSSSSPESINRREEEEQEESSSTLDPQLKKDSSGSNTSTISPIQAEYLSSVRIHVLEEENVQLKSQLEYELKKAHQFKCRLLKNRLGQSIGTDHQPPAIDQGLIELMLKDEEIENLLLSSSTPSYSASSTAAAVSSSSSSSSSSSFSSSPPAPLSLHSPSSSQHTQPNPDDLTQLSLDWDSLLLDRESSPSRSDGHSSFETIIQGTKERKISEDWPMMIDGLGSPESDKLLLQALDTTQPETPSPDQHPQAPADRQPAQTDPTSPQTAPLSHHRLVAREVLSLQRNGGESSSLGRSDLDRPVPEPSVVNELWAMMMMPITHSWTDFLSIIMMMLMMMIIIFSAPLMIIMSSKRLDPHRYLHLIFNPLSNVVVIISCLISCWVAWKNVGRILTAGFRRTSVTNNNNIIIKTIPSIINSHSTVKMSAPIRSTNGASSASRSTTVPPFKNPPPPLLYSTTLPSSLRRRLLLLSSPLQQSHIQIIRPLSSIFFDSG
ncbi:hypothetical protein PGTUg99_010223 [Puccinia graminis f. sp. tritici]|uniref:Uncharacterized protein n=1 Tax=Puccinia graminis f. sp. tritici TaxID=56615 RepID=A0A5B0RV97_PUCGR|nr:hypothetical protein PGTUg99_010223 [Puccinia graminis f. sp. tritici]